MGINETLRDLAVRHQILLYRLATGTATQVNALLKAVEADLIAQIAKYDPTQDGGGYSKQRLNKMLAAIKKINAANYAEVQDYLGSHLLDLAKYEADFQAKILNQELPGDWPLDQPSVANLESIVSSQPFQGRVLSDWVAGMEAGRLDRISQALNIGLVEGETIGQIAKRIAGTKALGYSDGALETSRRSAEALARTAVNYVTNAAKEAVFEKNPDVIAKVMWVSVLDSRTTPICQSRDGKVYLVGQGPRPPAHINCRSVITPITKSWRALGIPIDEISPGTRASVNGQVPATLTYGEWLKNQPLADIQEALGVTKAKLFLDGGLTVDKFVDRTGHAYTLDELRVRDAEAFRKAGLD